MITIESPAFAESIKEGDITFLKKVGDSVVEDEEIAKIETDKTAIEVKAPKAGVISELLVADGSTITANMPIIKLTLGGAAPAAAAPAASTPAPAAAKPAEAPKAAAAPPPPPPPSQQPRITPIPTAPAASIPISQIPITPAKLQSANMDINKIGGSRNETRVCSKSHFSSLLQPINCFL